MTNQTATRNPNSESPTTTANPDAATAIAQLRDHDDIDDVVTYDDHTRLNGVMVILDWVTDSSRENGTRIIHEKNYTGEIRRVAAFIDDLDGVRRTRGSKSGLARYTFHVEYTASQQ